MILLYAARSHASCTTKQGSGGGYHATDHAMNRKKNNSPVTSHSELQNKPPKFQEKVGSVHPSWGHLPHYIAKIIRVPVSWWIRPGDRWLGRIKGENFICYTQRSNFFGIEVVADITRRIKSSQFSDKTGCLFSLSTFQDQSCYTHYYRIKDKVSHTDHQNDQHQDIRFWFDVILSSFIAEKNANVNGFTVFLRPPPQSQNFCCDSRELRSLLGELSPLWIPYNSNTDNSISNFFWCCWKNNN